MKRPNIFGVTADMTVTFDPAADLVTFKPNTVAGDRLLDTYPIYEGGDLTVSTDLGTGVINECELAGLILVRIRRPRK